MSIELAEIRGTVDGAVNEIDAVVGMAESEERSRRAIAAHGALEEAMARLARYRKHAPDEEREELEHIRLQALGTVRRILQDVFTVKQAETFDPKRREEAEPPAHPSVGEGLVAIAKSIDHLAEAIHFTALPRWQRDRRTF